MEPKIFEEYPDSAEESVTAGQDVWWRKRLPLLLAALSVLIFGFGLFLDREEVAYLGLGRDVPGTIIVVKPPSDPGYNAPRSDYGPDVITYTFTVGTGELIQAQYIYGNGLPNRTWVQPLRVQYLVTDPRTNRPLGSSDWTDLVWALVFGISVAIGAFLVYLGRDWDVPWRGRQRDMIRWWERG